MDNPEIKINKNIMKLNKSLSENKNALVVFILISALVFFLFFYVQKTIFYKNYSSILNLIFASFFAFLLFFIIYCSFSVLRFYFKKRREIKNVLGYSVNNKAIRSIISDIYEKINEINEREDLINETVIKFQKETRDFLAETDLNSLKSTIESVKRNSEELKIANRGRNIQDKLEVELKYYLKNKMYDILVDRFRNQLKKEVKCESVNNNKIKISKSIDENIRKLDKFSIINLLIGLYFSTISILFFVLSSFSFHEMGEQKNFFIANSIQKVIFVVGLQTIGFLFFRSYRNNVIDRKYFLNEKTNIEVIFSALESSILTGDTESEKKIYEKMSEIERNFIVKNGETTINIKQQESEYDNDYKILNLMTKALDDAKKNINK
ncbi:M48 family metalloprotease [Acetobacter syzygii]|uniref:Uncharacterized protein n=1 Tax=Acetobacter syzygii TaxID=146476 RepID=A0A270BLY0_9PROT|nr:hypothetical protein [Acetobacter syzygii]PAL26023.1 hypothetical protein B9K05_07930 [Acetobacter syzygii]PAL26143.1 hypothetical protein B9K04_07425 [Acetobacter syzygii]